MEEDKQTTREKEIKDNTPNQLRKILEDRVLLLSRGIVVPPRKWWMPVRHLQSFYGGAGPQGRRYYICYSENEPSVSMISLPIYPKNHYLAKYAISTKRSKNNPHTLITEHGIILKGIPPAKTSKMKLGDGTPIEKSALFGMHCYNTYTTNMSWACAHYETGEQCKYCTINLRKKIWKLPEVPPQEHLIEALKLAVKYNKVRSITITSGTPINPQEASYELISLIKKMHEVANLSIHVQIEPVFDQNFFKDLSGVADSVGIFLEIFDEKIRKEICPGKARISKKQYIQAWKEAVKYFGRGNVGTSCLLGFGEDFKTILAGIEECANLGVNIMVLLVRPGSQLLGDRFIPSYIEKERELIDFHIKVGEILLKHNLKAEVGKGSGCIGCQGCSAMMEAYRYVKYIS
ncbi:MAG: hypothetical protein A2166_06200 [Omnitrophica WOR_2 bacterium RBG_13_41_10]|nr:MAG: hypothetical protein A2166_06200 [Omnitrophica WOR_2 bacterium RBG_13_41_10]